MLCVKNLSVTVDLYEILKNVNFSVKENEWLMIVGPNGAGKSTVINAISQGISYRGNIEFCGENITNLKRNEIGKRIGVLMQNHSVGYAFTVEEVVRQGRYSYISSIFSNYHEDNERKIEEALKMTGMSELRNHSVLTLSGGELQRTFLAQLLAQNPKLMILDEPTNHLDLVYQKQIFQLITAWVKKSGQAAISVVQDLSLAKAYGTHAVLMNHGEVIAFGTCDEVLTQDNLEKVYKMDVNKWMHDMLSQWN